MFNIVLVEPEIPQNTGNISRTCAVTGCILHLVHPLGFSVDDRYLKRAGLDYWKDLEIFYYDSYDEVENMHPNSRFYLFSTHASAKCYSDIEYKAGDFLVFGKETAGLGEKILSSRIDKAARIPMLPEKRSLNLSNSVAIVVYEAFRKNGFTGMV